MPGSSRRRSSSSGRSAVLGHSTMASTSRRSITRRSAAGERQVTTPGPLFGRVRRSASNAARLSSSAAMAATSALRPALHRRPGPPRPDRHQGPDHLTRAFEHAAGIVVAQRLERVLERAPLALGDALVALRRRLAVGTLEQKKVAVLVNVPAAKAKVPVDDPDRPLQHQPLEPGLLRGLPHGRLGRRLPILEVALGEPPVVVGVLDQEKPRSAVRETPEHDPARTHLQLRPPFAHQNTEILRYFLGCAWMSVSSSRNWMTVAVVSRYRVESVASMPSVPFPCWIRVISESACCSTRTRLTSLALAAAMTERMSAAAWRRSWLELRPLARMSLSWLSAVAVSSRATAF